MSPEDMDAVRLDPLARPSYVRHPTGAVIVYESRDAGSGRSDEGPGEGELRIACVAGVPSPRWRRGR